MTRRSRTDEYIAQTTIQAAFRPHRDNSTVCIMTISVSLAGQTVRYHPTKGVITSDPRTCMAHRSQAAALKWWYSRSCRLKEIIETCYPMTKSLLSLRDKSIRNATRDSHMASKFRGLPPVSTKLHQRSLFMREGYLSLLRETDIL